MPRPPVWIAVEARPQMIPFWPRLRCFLARKAALAMPAVLFLVRVLPRRHSPPIRRSRRHLSPLASDWWTPTAWPSQQTEAEQTRPFHRLRDRRRTLSQSRDLDPLRHTRLLRPIRRPLQEPPPAVRASRRRAQRIPVELLRPPVGSEPQARRFRAQESRRDHRSQEEVPKTAQEYRRLEGRVREAVREAPERGAQREELGVQPAAQPALASLRLLRMKKE